MSENKNHNAIVDRLGKLPLPMLRDFLKTTSKRFAKAKGINVREARRLTLERYPIIGERLGGRRPGVVYDAMQCEVGLPIPMPKRFYDPRSPEVKAYMDGLLEGVSCAGICR